MRRTPLSLALLASLAGCGSQGEAKGEASVSVVESGFTQGQGTLSLGVVLANESRDADAVSVSVVANALDAAGNVVATAPAEVGVVPADERFNVGLEVEVDTDIADIEVSADAADSEPSGELGLPRVTNVRYRSGSPLGDGWTARAQVENTLDEPLSELAAVFAVVRDAQGQVVAGGYGLPASDIPPGGRQAVKVLSEVDVPAGDSADVSVDNEVAFE